MIITPFAKLHQKHIKQAAIDWKCTVTDVIQHIRKFSTCPSCWLNGYGHYAWCRIVKEVRQQTGWIITDPFTEEEIQIYNSKERGKD